MDVCDIQLSALSLCADLIGDCHPPCCVGKGSAVEAVVPVESLESIRPATTGFTYK